MKKDGIPPICSGGIDIPPFRVLYSYMKKDNIPSAATARANRMTLIDEFTDSEGDVTSVYAVTREQWSESSAAADDR